MRTTLCQREFSLNHNFLVSV